MSSLLTPLAKVRADGAAHHGASHWWAERVSAVALIFLCVWFVYHLTLLAGQPVDALQNFFSAPHNALLTVALLVIGFYHGAMGLQVVLEDYVHDKFLRNTLILIVRALGFIFAGLAVMGVIKLHFFVA